MDIDWNPKSDPPSLVKIPEVFVQFEPAARERWIAAQARFEQSSRKDYLTYGEYGRFAEEGRFRLPYSTGPKMKFAEFHTALLLDGEGFEGWSQVHLFDDPMPLFKDGQPVRRGRDNAVPNTLHIMRHPGWRWRWPSEIQQTLDFRPRNPDIVAYRQGKRPEWRFCEVKGPSDKCSGGHFTEQLNTLAVLHLLTGSPVAIVRPVEQRQRPRIARTYEAHIKYKRGARLDWIRL